MLTLGTAVGPDTGSAPALAAAGSSPPEGAVIAHGRPEPARAGPALRQDRDRCVGEVDALAASNMRLDQGR